MLMGKTLYTNDFQIERLLAVFTNTMAVIKM